MPPGRNLLKPLLKTSKATLEEITDRLFTKQGGKITKEYASEMMQHSPRVRQQPSSLLTLKHESAGAAAKGERNLGMEQAMRVERGTAEEAYQKSPELFSPKPYGVQPTSPQRRVRFATDEDPVDEILGGKIMYEGEESQMINPQGLAKKELMATPVAKLIGDAQWGKYLWNSMTVKEIGKIEARTIGRGIWTSLYNKEKRGGTTSANSPMAYFQLHFGRWKNERGYAKSQPEKAQLLEELWDVFKPEGG